MEITYSERYGGFCVLEEDVEYFASKNSRSIQVIPRDNRSRIASYLIVGKKAIENEDAFRETWETGVIQQVEYRRKKRDKKQSTEEQLIDGNIIVQHAQLKYVSNIEDVTAKWGNRGFSILIQCVQKEHTQYNVWVYPLLSEEIVENQLKPRWVESGESLDDIFESLELRWATADSV